MLSPTIRARSERSILQRGARHRGGIDDTGFDEIDELAGGRVVADVARAFPHLRNND
ncbi:hypothetical protein QZM18_25280 [Burkholderia diffusa]|uniref:hypothetical protein n=1 Tax=Burkholderia diffusa TaxID=488732 RepID=UPI00264F6500|nr:hypothetical protein [Burkholderia diffusa]MDN7907405.1 hypothetical protein [Burkholderia diffusa]